jgi:uncharacterized protein (TIGR00369 family)
LVYESRLIRRFENLFKNCMHQVQESLDYETLASRLNLLAAVRAFGAHISFSESGESLVQISDIKDIHTGGMESRAVNGMVLMGLLDSAICAVSIARLKGRRCATVEMSTRFIKPVSSNVVLATGRVVSRSGNLLYCEASIVNKRGRPLVQAFGLVHAI